ncbi:hypothetical protein MMC10_010919 [Thelotrema lepadinum]|nr:hypothetical protein [Thelotrema lepadinum]
MATTYTVIIHNESGGSSNKIYNVYSDPTGISGSGFQSAKSVNWYKTRPLPNKSQSTLKYTDSIYAVVSYTSKLCSKVANGDSVDTQATMKINVGTSRNDGTVVYLSKDLAFSELTDQKASKGTFKIETDAGIKYPDHYMVGIARGKDVNGTITPSSTDVVELKPNAELTFTPHQPLYVRATTYAEGTIQDVADGPTIKSGKAIKIEFLGGDTQADVTEDSSGIFTVEYS